MSPDRRTVIRGAALVGFGALAGGLELGRSLSAGAAVVPPTIANCPTWGARAPGSLSVIASNPNKILVHHTATANSTDYSQAHAYALARSIQNYHMDHNGWSDTGQHFTISRGGYVMEGRHHSLPRLNAGSGMVIGAHCPGQNDQSIGIENEGLYTSVAPTSALYDQLVNLCAYICQQYGIAATRIYGHRDFHATACPGDMLYGMLPRLRTDVAAKLGGGSSFSAVVDNATAGRFRASANWGTSAFSAARYGADYRFANPEPISDGAYYKVNIPTTASYRVDAWYPSNSGYNDRAPYIVFTTEGARTVYIDQRSGGGGWVSLGSFTLAAGDHEVVAVSRWTAGTGYVIADAIRVSR